MSKRIITEKAEAGKGVKKTSEFYNLVEQLISVLPERSRDILKKRFGIVEDGKAQTLDKIGRDYKITRERIRQIVADALKAICKNEEREDFKRAEEKIIFAIEKNNGIIKETQAIEGLNLDGLKEENAIRFFVACSQKIKIKFEKSKIEKSWTINDIVIEKVKKVEAEAIAILEEKKKPLLDKDIAELLVLRIPEFSTVQVLSYLGVLFRVKRNIFGKWGINNWMEIRPKGSKERVYLMLKEEGRPLHFNEVATLIDKYKLSKKKSHPQTIHNELIKDDRFVLIGRGIYALKEWGYYEGTIKDVINNILSKSIKSLNRDEIMDEVLKIRKVKKTTVMINLNNPKFFKREAGLYSLK